MYMIERSIKHTRASIQIIHNYIRDGLPYKLYISILILYNLYIIFTWLFCPKLFYTRICKCNYIYQILSQWNIHLNTLHVICCLYLRFICQHRIVYNYTRRRFYTWLSSSPVQQSVIYLVLLVLDSTTKGDLLKEVQNKIQIFIQVPKFQNKCIYVI